MATLTTRLSLRKPAGTDLVNVTTDISNNADIIDAGTAVLAATNTFTTRQTITPATDSGDSGVLSLQRASTAHAQFLTLAVGVAYNYQIGRSASSDDFKFGYNGGGGFVEDIRFTPGGPFQFKGNTLIGGGIFGAAAAFLTVGNSGSVGYIAVGHGTLADADLSIQSKGAGAVRILNGSGTPIVFLNDSTGSGTGVASYCWALGAVRRFETGAADSAGVGFRTIRVAN